MSNLLKEILDMKALPFKWVDDARCIFSFDDKKFGIFVEYQTLDLGIHQHDGIDLGNRILDIANVSFGIIDKQFKSADDLDTKITNFGKPRTILSTVAEACIQNKQLTNCDVLCLAAADQAKEKRLNIYSLALSEIKSKLKKFSVSFLVKTSNDSRVLLLSKMDFSDEDKNEISEKLEINKI